MSIHFLPGNDPDCKNLWQYFIEHNDVSWRYLLARMEYQKIYCYKTLVQDCSFLIKNNEIVIAICPLFLEEHKGQRFFSSNLEYQIAPLISSLLSKKQQKKAQQLCFGKIDELAQKYNVVKSMFQVDSLIGSYTYNILSQYHYIDTSSQTSIIDLKKDIKFLWSDLRKSFKSLINNGKNKFNIFIMDSSNPDYNIHELYRKLHHKTSGRITRPVKTFDMQFEDLKNDKAILIGLRDEERFVGFSYFSHHKDMAYYGSASDDPDYESKIPLEHCIIWSAIEYYKKRNFKFLEIGNQQFGPQFFDHPSQKDLNISFFKRGFGGNIVPLYRGIKFYDKTFMEKELIENLKMMEVYWEKKNRHGL